MNVPTLEEQRQAWQRIPVDDVGYMDSADLLRLSDDGLNDLINRMCHTRYTGWRNYEGRWRHTLGLDTTVGKKVMDYGCGVGIEALQYAQADNFVDLVDIVPSNVELAWRVLSLRDRGWWGEPMVIRGDERDINIVEPESRDIIHCAGVLHHIVEPRPVVERMHRWLRPGGELRLMLYSDVGWMIYTGTEPPDDVTDHPAREIFVRAFDQVGGWADWYSADRLTQRFGDLFQLRDWTYLTPNDRYMAATMVRQ